MRSGNGKKRRMCGMDTQSFSRIVAFVIAFVAFSAALPLASTDALALPLGDALGNRADNGVPSPDRASPDRASEPARVRHSEPEPARGPAPRLAADAADPVRKTAEPLAKTVTETVDPVAEAVKPLTDNAVESLTRTAEPVLKVVEPAVGSVELVVSLAASEPEASAPEESAPMAPELMTVAPVDSGSIPEPTAVPGLEPVVDDEPLRVATSSEIEPVFAAASVAAEPRFQDTAVQSNDTLPLPKPATAPAASQSTVAYPAPGVEEGTAADSSSRGLRSPFGRIPIAGPLAPFGLFATEGALNQVPWPFSTASAAVRSLSGLSAGFGGGIGVGVLALLFGLAPPGRRLLRAFRGFLRPNSALRLVPELPG
jgi:hypothetical protein